MAADVSPGAARSCAPGGWSLSRCRSAVPPARPFRRRRGCRRAAAAERASAPGTALGQDLIVQQLLDRPGAGLRQADGARSLPRLGQPMEISAMPSSQRLCRLERQRRAFLDQAGDLLPADDGVTPAARPLLQLILRFREMFADDGEAVADLPPVRSAQALDLLGDVLPVDFIGRAPAQRIGLVVGPGREV